MEDIIIRGLTQNNLKNISLDIPKNKIVVFTGPSGSGKSSVVFDTIAAEARRQINETYPAFVRNRMPKYEKPEAQLLKNLSAAVVVDQTGLTGNMRSTVGTASELYNALRLMFSRIGKPYVGAASCFSFNDPAGFCPECSGLGKLTDININAILDKSLSLNDGAVTDSLFKKGSWYHKLYINCGFFDPDKPLNDYSIKEMNLLLYGAEEPGKTRINDKIDGLYNIYKKRYLTRDVSVLSSYQKDKALLLVEKKLCPACHGHRLNRDALACWINGYNISELCDMELTELRQVISRIDDTYVKTLTDSLIAGLDRLINIGLGYLCLSRETPSLSGGEAQRLKLVKYLGSSLSDMLYIFDEPSAGMHPRDVYRMNKLLKDLKQKGNSVLVVEHDKDVISVADEIIDMGPLAGKQGGQVVFQGDLESLKKADTLTSKAFNESVGIKKEFRTPSGYLSIKNANLHNLKDLSVDIPKNVVCVITGVAGSGKSSLTKVLVAAYPNEIIYIDQSPISANSRSNPASYLGFNDEIRELLSEENNVPIGLFSYNSTGACHTCNGKGEILTELVYMDPTIHVCEDCGGTRFNKEALSYKYKGKNILDIFNLTCAEAREFFDDEKILKSLNALCDVGLSYLNLGQPLSTLSGGERQRIKLAKNLKKKGAIYVFDEPTTGLHPSDCDKLVKLFESFTHKGSSVIVIEHNMDVIKRADYIIDIGPDGGKNGGEVVFCGTPAEMLNGSDTITAKCLRADINKQSLSETGLGEIYIGTDKTNEQIEEETMFKLYPIGKIVNKDDSPYIMLDKTYAQALKGLKDFKDICVYWWFDGCDTVEERSRLCVEKPYVNGPEILGTFATRSPSRPNPIGVSVCEITFLDEENGLIGLSYTDAMDATPVLDIKPYTPSIDRVDKPVAPAWCAHWPDSIENSADFDWEKEFNF